MKKLMTLILALVCAAGLAGCSGMQNDNTPATGEEKRDLIPMVMVDGVLYLDTGHSNTAIRKCGTPDGEISSSVDGSEKPAENDQSNFGTGYGYQYGATEGTVEIYLNDKWRIFATEKVRQQIQFPEKYTEPDGEIPGAATFIVDIWDRAKEEGLPCDEAVEPFYEDDKAVYCFSCIKSHYIMVLDNTGRTIDIVTALSEGLATMADLDHYGIEYYTEPKSEIAEPYVSIPGFSYAEDCEAYAEGDPGVKMSGFVNISEAEINSPADADERAKNECTVEWDTVTTYFDAAAGIWKVVFSTDGTLGGCQSVYLRDNGTTALIVYGE